MDVVSLATWRGIVQRFEDDREEGKQWGSWLKASPRKGQLELEEEAKQFLSCSKKLVFGAR